MDFLTTLIENSNLPILSAFILGLMTAISPCPLATNITAIGFISRDIQSQKRVFINGLIYTLGRILSYTGLAFILYFSANTFKISGFFQQYGEKFLGPLLILISLFMLGLIKLNIPGFGKFSEKMQQKEKTNYWDVLLIGVLFALAFCPYSGVLYFGMLIPMTISSSSGLYLPIFYAIATGLPVILFAWVIAYTVSGIGSLYNKIKTFELWFRRIIAVLFLLIGIYYTIIVFI
ncbi:MAG: cytochrome C biogenesis protein [Bacteroidetes bacterium GWC2_33_15]|nr:MAG: cytochrome C biogenesis protein [Bacteroidetes bacterium GWA2_33_15]OFX50440.1 MAG: cytochrome C biogenesis protein [Bacteroidetes bacterium GWC2_33_15]OFX66642.1 MAG: cytochrome C biogenesis protein [Bacteroidetes bacterium GWB2_32_14]OFX69260.1 MAG: cytochrome C biogenesis protein [Bacteroidetes bacterium GWD2_33_33]HAN18575.1 cytochrome C biogenesis protein [Bacteroidales bacterium]